MSKYTINDQLLTVAEIAEIAGVSVHVVRREMNAGRMPCKRIGRRMLCPVTAFEDYINELNGRPA